MDDEGKLDLQKLLFILAQHKGLAIAVFTVIFSLAAYLAYTLPNIYRSKAVILFVPQELPDSYVQSTVTMTMQERVNAITREILSRSTLEKIIKELNLYGHDTALTMGDRIRKMRENIDVDADEGKNEFRLSFESRSPVKAKKVVARLTSVYVDETLKKGEEQAKETTAFMQVEAESLKGEVERLEQRVNRYKARHRYELPEQLNLNLMTLERLSTGRQSNLLRIAAIQDSKANLETELIATREQGGEKVFTRMDHVDKMRLDLETLLSKYGDRHPDIISLKREIKAIETGEGIDAPPVEPDSVLVHLERDPVKKMLLIQIQDLETETKTLQAKNKLLLDKITLYQSRINNTAARDIELSKLTRTYEVTQKQYEDLHRKILESKLTESMQKQKKATRFQILDPAYIPSEPSRPKRHKIVVIGLILGLAAGFGLSILLEAISTIINNADELKAAVDLPLLASIPLLKTRGNILEKRRRQLVAAMLCVGAIGLGAALIRYYSQHIY